MWVGGLKIHEPAADLAVAASLISALADVPMPEGMVCFGEVGLSGEVRPVAHSDSRLQEAKKLGFMGAIMPPPHEAAAKKEIKDFKQTPIRYIRELKGQLAA